MMIRPPNRSVHMPSGSRKSAPVSTGVAVRMPNWVESSPSWVRIGMPVTPNIIHTAKHTVKAQVVTSRTDILFSFDIRASYLGKRHDKSPSLIRRRCQLLGCDWCLRNQERLPSGHFDLQGLDGTESVRSRVKPLKLQHFCPSDLSDRIG